jgi:hypothetical protein
MNVVFTEELSMIEHVWSVTTKQQRLTISNMAISNDALGCPCNSLSHILHQFVKLWKRQRYVIFVAVPIMQQSFC